MATDKPRKPSQTERLLAAYAAAGETGLTDEEAAAASGLLKLTLCCWWKRCGELRKAGRIEPAAAVGDIPVTRRGTTGHPRRVCRITVDGLRDYQRLVRSGVLR